MAANIEQEESPEFELGDSVFIDGGKLDQTRGRIYYMDEDLIRILPVGVSDRLIDIPLVDGDFNEALGIQNFYLLSKRANPAFVAQVDMQVDNIIDTFDEQGAPGIEYTVKEINEDEDTATLLDETGGEKRIEFDFRGIPLDEPFAVLRPRQAAAAANEAAEAAAAAAAAAEEDAAAAAEEEDIFENVGFEVPDEEEEIVGLVERPVTKRTYPDIVQRNEMFQNLLEMIDIKSQKNPKRQREIRQLVEQLLLLRNQVVAYDINGEPAGHLATSFQTIAELLEKADIPLARPVLEAARTLNLDFEEEGVNPIELPGRAVDIQYMGPVLDQMNDYLNTQLGGTTAQVLVPDALPQWFVTWEAFFKRFMRSWVSQGGPAENIAFRGDKEFLRAPIPNGEDGTADGLPRPSPPLKVKDVVTSSLVGKVRLSLLKGLGPRSTRLKDKEPLRRIESGDEGMIVSQLLFPLGAQRDLGLSRSGKVMKDIAFSHSTPRSLLTILQEMEGVPDEATAGGIISIGEGGNTSGNIALEDWIRAQPLRLRGLGDALVELKNMGLAQRELTVDQQEVLLDKIRQFRALLKQHITAEREASTKEIAALRLENIPFLQGEALEDLMAVLAAEPLLAARIEEIKARTPAYRDNDIGLVAGICTTMADLFLTTMAGVPGPLARERNRRVRDQFLEALRQALLKAVKKSEAGQIPEPIKCPHVSSLNEIRKVRNDDERMQLLARLLGKFRGPRSGNWITCAASSRGNPHNLLCYHEVLQLQEYLHPREKDTLHKELLLAFSGGVFQGRYICKNCGQPISDMEFDQTMEFDDNGRPMAGRAMLVDRGLIQEEDLNLLLGAPTEAAEEIKFATEGQTLIYQTARQVFDKVGIYADMDTYKHIVERVEAEIHKQPSREEYARIVKARASKQEGKALDYDVLLNRILVSAVAAHALIEIQTHVPDYVLRSKLPGCVAGFSGFPIGKEEDKTGINYISCAVASIKTNAVPWSLTGFFAQSSDKKRQEMIAGGVTKLCADALKTAAVQQLAAVKRAYYERVYGSAATGDRIPEFIPPGFLPVPDYITAEEATKAIIVPEAASPQERVRGWIQMAHRLARENGTYVRGSPFSETTCCYTPVAEPRGFWSAQTGLPQLPKREPPVGRSCSQVMLRFTPRRVARLLADPPEDLFYRVFLRVCYDGPRKGFPHEPGYTNTCPHCGFVFPDNPYTETPAPPLTKDLFKEWKTETDAIIMKGKSALESQKVVIDRATFDDVLDAAHTNYHVSMPERIEPATGSALLGRLALMEPTPFEAWKPIMAATIEGVTKLPKAADEIAVAQAYGPLSNYMVDTLGDIQRRLGPASAKALQGLLQQSPSQIVESMRTYFLVPFQRLVLGFKPESMQVQKSYQLPKDTQDDIHKALGEHLAYLNTLKKVVKGYTLIKLDQARKQLAVALTMIQKEVRADLVPGGALGLPYLVGTLVIGILGEFINPNIIPEGVSGTGGVIEATARVPLNILEVCISRLQLEGLTFTEAEIRDLIARRIEAEKMTFIGRLDKMNPEDKKSELMMKRLGLGAWAVGGTKAIYSLDPDQYEREREQRMEMGLGDFLQDPAAVAAAAAALQDDAFGGGGAGTEGGYDNDQMAADDY